MAQRLAEQDFSNIKEAQLLFAERNSSEKWRKENYMNEDNNE